MCLLTSIIVFRTSSFGSFEAALFNLSKTNRSIPTTGSHIYISAWVSLAVVYYYYSSFRPPFPASSAQGSIQHLKTEFQQFLKSTYK